MVICPAQFGTAKDYEEMIAELEARGHPAIALDLGRFDWLKITRSVLTPDYWQGRADKQGHEHASLWRNQCVTWVMCSWQVR